VPREVLVPVLPPDPDLLARWLSGLRGAQVDLRVPQRGDKRALMDTVQRNADQSLARHKVARAGDLTARSQALQELQDTLEMADAPLRIECFDVSHVQGTNVVASMVVFEDGLPRKSEYRRFIVRGTVDEQGQVRTDDTAAMHEVLTRRFRRYLDDRVDATDIEGVGSGAPGADDRDRDDRDRNDRDRNDRDGAGSAGGGRAGGRPGSDDEDGTAGPSRIDPDTGRPRRFAYPPNLVVVDGGLPQVNAARAALAELGVDDVALVGLAKRLEEVWLPGQEFPVILPRTSEGLYLLQRVRDEAHRFAITFHRQRRSKAMTSSALDDIPGLGESRRKALLRHFGSVKKVRGASEEQIREVPGIGPSLAATIAQTLAAQAAQSVPAVNVTTGEVLD
jgi:excinuclease ABC subunit C